jgi:hypothetical protein
MHQAREHSNLLASFAIANVCSAPFHLPKLTYLAAYARIPKELIFMRLVTDSGN